MGIMSFLEQKKAKSLIRKHIISTYDLYGSDVDIIMQSSAMKNTLSILGTINGSYIPFDRNVQLTMVLVADKFMEDLINRASFEKLINDDRVKLKYCIGIMVDILLDGWPYSDNIILRLDLWKNYWAQIDKERSRFIKKEDPFIPAVFYLIVKNNKSGLLQLSSDYPYEEIKEEIQLAYD